MAALLPPEALLAHLDTIELLKSMYPEELSILPSYRQALEEMQNARPKLEANEPLSGLPSELRFMMLVALEDAEALQLEICFPLSQGFQGNRLLLKPPSFLSRKQYELLQEGITQPESEDAFVDNLLDSIDGLKSRGSKLLLEASEASLSKSKDSGPVLESDDVGLDRVWFWL